MIELTRRGGIADRDDGSRQGQRARHRVLRRDRGAVRGAARLGRQGGGADRAGPDVLRRRQSHPAERGRRGLRAALSAGAAPALRHGVLLSEARGGRGQRPRHRRRLRAAVLRRPAHRRARRRPHRRDRASGRRAVSAAGVRGDAVCDAAALSRRGMFSGATFRPTWRWRAAWSTNWPRAAALLDRAVAAAETLAALSPAAFAQTKQQIRQPVADAHGAARPAAIDRGGAKRSGPRRRRSITSAITSRARFKKT